MAWFNKFIQGAATGLGAGIGLGSQAWLGRKQEEEREQRGFDRQAEFQDQQRQKGMGFGFLENFLENIPGAILGAPTEAEGVKQVEDGLESLAANLPPEFQAQVRAETQRRIIEVAKQLEGGKVSEARGITAGSEALMGRTFSSDLATAEQELTVGRQEVETLRGRHSQLTAQNEYLSEPMRLRIASSVEGAATALSAADKRLSDLDSSLQRAQNTPLHETLDYNAIASTLKNHNISDGAIHSYVSEMRKMRRHALHQELMVLGSAGGSAESLKKLTSGYMAQAEFELDPLVNALHLLSIERLSEKVSEGKQRALQEVHHQLPLIATMQAGPEAEAAISTLIEGVRTHAPELAAALDQVHITEFTQEGGLRRALRTNLENELATMTDPTPDKVLALVRASANSEIAITGEVPMTGQTAPLFTAVFRAKAAFDAKVGTPGISQRDLDRAAQDRDRILQPVRAQLVKLYPDPEVREVVFNHLGLPLEVDPLDVDARSYLQRMIQDTRGAMGDVQLPAMRSPVQAFKQAGEEIGGWIGRGSKEPEAATNPERQQKLVESLGEVHDTNSAIRYIQEAMDLKSDEGLSLLSERIIEAQEQVKTLGSLAPPEHHSLVSAIPTLFSSIKDGNILKLVFPFEHYPLQRTGGGGGPLGGAMIDRRVYNFKRKR